MMNRQLEVRASDRRNIPARMKTIKLGRGKKRPPTEAAE